MSLPALLDELKRLCPPGKAFKPHKLLLLLAVVRIVRATGDRNMRIYYSESLKDEFGRLLNEYGGMDDRNRPYAPFYHLRSSSFWHLVPVPGQEAALSAADSVGGPNQLLSLIQYAELAGDMRSAILDESQLGAVEMCLQQALKEGNSARRLTSHSNSESTASELWPANMNEPFPTLDLTQLDTSEGNPFVAYLNSMQRLSGGNSNALAEFQSRSPYFASIHVPHPLVDTITAELSREGGRTVILAGHAGDGKSTIALDVYRRFTGRDDGAPLPRDPAHREDLDGGVTILKDLSEREKGQDAELWNEISANARRFLVVSNTGALLEFLKGQAERCGVEAFEMESRVLTALDSETGDAELTLGSLRLLVFNLARVDNLAVARLIFERMIARDRWTVCEGRPCQENCPIWRNVELLQNHRETILDRLFLAYRRMHEYGTRLTLRQLTEHLAYLVTSGIEEADIQQMQARGERQLKARYMFFNRFFGDDGRKDDIPALHMRAVQEVRRQGFGGRPCPTWERKLWLKLRGANFRLNVPECDVEFDRLREHGSGGGYDSSRGLLPDEAREQIRRMLYFLYDFEAGDRTFLQHYLNSAMLLQWRHWQSGARLDVPEKSTLEQRIFHVLQEHFTGVRLPEGTHSQDRRLYVTLSRRGDIRQSAQVVVADVDWGRETTLELVTSKDVAGGERVDLTLRGRRRLDGTELRLTLPFLDYMLMRHFGELGETLQAAYVERLDRFKTSVQELAKEDDGHALLVRLRVDHTFRRQSYAVNDGKLEVSDAL